MKSIDFLEILKLGLPGLVFLLSLLSCWLQAREQKRPEVREAVLKTIQKYIYINAAFVVLTVATPSAESAKSQEFTVKATSQVGIKKGVAAVCNGANYADRYLLIRNPKNLGKLIQVQAKTVIPCNGETIITISPEDANGLGWDAGISTDNVAVAAAIQSGTKFVM